MILSEIISRKSVRSYLNREVEDKKLREVLEAGRIAPSACNIQPWKFVVVRDENKRKLLADASKGQTFVADSPVVIVGCLTEKGFNMAGWFDSGILDVGLALDHMTIQAVHLSLGTCWIGDFDEESVKKILNIPEEIRVVAMLTLGYPRNSNFSGKDRKSFKEVVSFDEY